MQTITITISGLQPNNIVLKESKSEEAELATKLTKLLKIIQPKEAVQQ